MTIHRGKRYLNTQVTHTLLGIVLGQRGLPAARLSQAAWLIGAALTWNLFWSWREGTRFSNNICWISVSSLLVFICFNHLFYQIYYFLIYILVDWEISFSLSVSLSIYLTIWLYYMYLSDYIPTYLALSICIDLPIYLSLYLSIYLSIYLSVCLSSCK